MYRGGQLLSEGHLFRGVEKFVPSFIRNPLKAYRFATEGALTLNGDPLVEDISALGIALNIVGLTPSQLSEVYAENESKKRYLRHIQQRRNNLLSQRNAARVLGDYEEIRKLDKKIQTFNKTKYGRHLKITADSKRSSYKSYVHRRNVTEDGIFIPPSMVRVLNEVVGREQN